MFGLGLSAALLAISVLPIGLNRQRKRKRKKKFFDNSIDPNKWYQSPEIYYFSVLSRVPATAENPDLRELLSSSELANEEPPPEQETQVEPVVLSSVPDTSKSELEGSDEEEEHPEAQAQALRDYQLTRDRARRVPKEHTRYDSTDHSFFLSQKPFLQKIISKFSMHLCKPIITPLASHFKLSDKTCPKTLT
ncbi:hypothetical protein M9H77_14015 [Catharanthus roseus]|uniref:Uncharacterized protein n=1 Tax=Catharanthus roseus TaxID=4058 RepID=A0ACC0BLU6_CATRO|nr:hypothetical protein M9H77_14015 [Catharanthus roseus]